MSSSEGLNPSSTSLICKMDNTMPTTQGCRETKVEEDIYKAVHSMHSTHGCDYCSEGCYFTWIHWKYFRSHLEESSVPQHSYFPPCSIFLRSPYWHLIFTSLFVIISFPHNKCNPLKGKDHLLCFITKVPTLIKCLAHSRWSINICWKNDSQSVTIIKGSIRARDGSKMEYTQGWPLMPTVSW